MSEESCWSTIGVWGDQKPRCHLLEQVVHCRNCEVFVKAGRQLLDRKVSEQEQAEAALRFAAEATDQGQDTESIMVFEIAGERLGLASSVMQAVVSTRSPHTVPHRSNSTFLGFVAIRGRLKLCVALNEVLGIEETETDSSETRMLVVNHQDKDFVFPVARVVGLQRHDTHKIAIAGTQTSAIHSSCLRGVLDEDEQPISLLDTERLWQALAKEVGL